MIDHWKLNQGGFGRYRRQVYFPALFSIETMLDEGFDTRSIARQLYGLPVRESWVWNQLANRDSWRVYIERT